MDDWRNWHCNETLQGYDTVDVTAPIQSGGAAASPSVVLAVQGWSWAGGARGHGGHSSQGGIMLLLTMRFADGTTQSISTKAANATSPTAAEQPWMTFNATPAFNPGGGIGGMYFQPAENIVMAHWPAGWRLPGYDVASKSGWHPAVTTSSSGAKLPAKFARKRASAVVQRYRPAAALKPVVPANCSGYRYRVDMGRSLLHPRPSCTFGVVHTSKASCDPNS